MKMIVLKPLETRSAKGRSAGSACSPQSSVECKPGLDATGDSRFAAINFAFSILYQDARGMYH